MVVVGIGRAAGWRGGVYDQLWIAVAKRMDSGVVVRSSSHRRYGAEGAGVSGRRGCPSWPAPIPGVSAAVGRWSRPVGRWSQAARFWRRRVGRQVRPVSAESRNRKGPQTVAARTDSWRQSRRVASVLATAEACGLGRMERRSLACRIARVNAAVWRACRPPT